MECVVGDLDEIATAVADERRAGRTVAVTNGAFDMLHVGHIRSLNDAATRADVLVVAVNSDASVREAKGPDRPVHPLAERMEVLAALAAVDYVTWFDEETCDHVLEAIRPDMHAKGPDYTTETIPERRALKRLGIPLVIVGDPKNHSTSAITSKRRDGSKRA